MSKSITISDATYTLIKQLKYQATRAQDKTVTFGQVVDCLIELARK
jgi:hypothetical protein